MWNTFYEKDNECAKQKNISSLDSNFFILAHEFISELNSETEQFLDKRLFPTYL